MSNSNTTLKPQSLDHLKHQRGVVLILALTILMVLTLIGVSAMKTSSLQERMSGNARDYQIAFEAAEAALRAGEDYVTSISTTTAFNATGNTVGAKGKYVARATTATGAWEIGGNWTAAKTESVAFANVSQNPKFIVEILDSTYGQVDSLDLGGSPTGVVSLFRVTARGYGKNPNTRVMLQADFGKLM